MSASTPGQPAVITEDRVREIVRDEIATIMQRVSANAVGPELQAIVDATDAIFRQHLEMPPGGDR